MASKPTIGGYMIFRDTAVTPAEGGTDLIYPAGIVLPFIGAVVLNLGDAVWLSADNTVNKSAVLADHSKSIGIVVGGDLTGGECGGPKAQYGAKAVNSIGAGGSPNVLVQVYGVQYVVCDAAMAVGPICASVTVAGRVRAASALAIAAGGVAVTSVAANGTTDITGDGQSRVIGRLLQAAAAPGDVRLALIGIN